MLLHLMPHAPAAALNNTQSKLNFLNVTSTALTITAAAAAAVPYAPCPQIPGFTELSIVSLLGALMSVAYCTIAVAMSGTVQPPAGSVNYEPMAVPRTGLERWMGIFNALTSILFAYGERTVEICALSCLMATEHAVDCPTGMWSVSCMYATEGTLLTCLDMVMAVSSTLTYTLCAAAAAGGHNVALEIQATLPRTEANRTTVKPMMKGINITFVSHAPETAVKCVCSDCVSAVIVHKYFTILVGGTTPCPANVLLPHVLSSTSAAAGHALFNVLLLLLLLCCNNAGHHRHCLLCGCHLRLLCIWHWRG
jgi:hypothetical protein